MLNADRLNGVDSRLVELVTIVDKEIPLCVVCGFRGEVEQNKAFMQGLSKLKYPKSSHNKIPARAVDLAPLNEKNQINWRDIESFKRLNTCMQKHAQERNLKIRWGGNFSFKDYVHFEL